jgi:hypothetical protein
MLQGQVSLQGRGTPGPSWQVPLMVSFYRPGETAPAVTLSATATAQGSFVLAGAPVGVYQVRVKQAQAISRQSSSVTFTMGLTQSVSFGQLSTGDVDNNDIVDVVDFSLLRASFAQSTTCAAQLPPAVPCADLDASTLVDVVDFSLLRASFSLAGPQPTP